MKLAEARKIADGLIERLSPHCDKIAIGGSIRRRKAEAGDIEIVACPKYTAGEDYTTEGLLPLFGKELTVKINHAIIPEWNAALREICIMSTAAKGLIKGKPDGRMMQIDLGPIKLDLFIVHDSDPRVTEKAWGKILAIRTGSKDFSYHHLGVAWKRLGWVGIGPVMRMESECIYKSGKWKVNIKKKPTMPRNGKGFPEERDFFNWLQIDYIEPWLRK